MGNKKKDKPRAQSVPLQSFLASVESQSKAKLGEAESSCMKARAESECPSRLIGKEQRTVVCDGSSYSGIEGACNLLDRSPKSISAIAQDLFKESPQPESHGKSPTVAAGAGPAISGDGPTKVGDGTTAGTKSFAEIFKDNRHSASGFTLTYIPSPCVSESDCDDLIMQPVDNVPFVDTWGYCLIGCFTGRYPGRAALDSITKSWGVRVRVLPHGRGWTIFRFLSEEDRSRVFQGGPYMCFGKTLMLRIVDKGTRLTEDLFTKIPTWVLLPEVPLTVWGQSGLSRLASKVGFPYHTDRVTRERSRILYARCLVEVDVTKKPILSFGVQLPEGGVGMFKVLSMKTTLPIAVIVAVLDIVGLRVLRRLERGGEHEVGRPRPSQPRGRSRGRSHPKPQNAPAAVAGTLSPTMTSVCVAVPASVISLPVVEEPVISVPLTSVPALSASMPILVSPLKVKSPRKVVTSSGVHKTPLVVSNSFDVLSPTGEASNVPKESTDITAGTITPTLANPPPSGVLDVQLSDTLQVVEGPSKDGETDTAPVETPAEDSRQEAERKKEELEKAKKGNANKAKQAQANKHQNQYKGNLRRRGGAISLSVGR